MQNQTSNFLKTDATWDVLKMVLHMVCLAFHLQAN